MVDLRELATFLLAATLALAGIGITCQTWFYVLVPIVGMTPSSLRRGHIGMAWASKCV
ncbi:hypothetical protein [Arthrobacter sp. W4I7]|uniref:hypothetical protein n=1 Tax=Arthrobacter sp. W4I7 TaxID=3042296 RepID=UPI0027D7DC06|nr:hypothetical protein [Arthrobacter sp. W4I7]